MEFNKTGKLKRSWSQDRFAVNPAPDIGMGVITERETEKVDIEVVRVQSLKIGAILHMHTCTSASHNLLPRTMLTGSNVRGTEGPFPHNWFLIFTVCYSLV